MSLDNVKKLMKEGKFELALEIFNEYFEKEENLPVELKLIKAEIYIFHRQFSLAKKLSQSAFDLVNPKNDLDNYIKSAFLLIETNIGFYQAKKGIEILEELQKHEPRFKELKTMSYSYVKGLKKEF